MGRSRGAKKLSLSFGLYKTNKHLQEQRTIYRLTDLFLKDNIALSAKRKRPDTRLIRSSLRVGRGTNAGYHLSGAVCDWSWTVIRLGKGSHG